MTLKLHQEPKQSWKARQPTDHQQTRSTAQHTTPWNHPAKKKFTKQQEDERRKGKGMRRRRGGKGRGQDDKHVKRQTRVISSSNVYWICLITGTHFIGSDYLQHSSGGGNSAEPRKEIKKPDLMNDQCLRSSSYSQKTLLNCSSLKVVGWRRSQRSQIRHYKSAIISSNQAE